MSMAVSAADAGRHVEVLDDAILPRGTLGALFAEDAAPWAPLCARFDRHVAARAIALRAATTAAALYGDDLLVAGAEGAEVVTARALVLAPGAHDGVLAFEGNDVPGVLSARAAGWLLAKGVVPGERLLVCVSAGSGGMGEAFARAVARVAPSCQVELVHGEPVRADGSARVKAVVVRSEGVERRIKADTLVLDSPRAPSYELCEQAGAALVHAPCGFVPQVKRGKVREGVFALGEVTGAPFDAATFEAAAREITAQL